MKVPPKQYNRVLFQAEDKDQLNKNRPVGYGKLPKICQKDYL